MMPLIHGSRERDWPQEGPRRVISPCEFTGCRVGISSRRSWLGELDKQLKERNKACRCGKGIFIVFLPDGRRTESRDSRSCMSRRLAPDCLTAASLTKVRSTPSGATPPLDNHTRKTPSHSFSRCSRSHGTNLLTGSSATCHEQSWGSRAPPTMQFQPDTNTPDPAAGISPEPSLRYASG